MRKSNAISNTRDLGLGAGKGDANRSVNDANWRTRFDIIRWRSAVDVTSAIPEIPGFVRVGHKLIKKYA